MALKIVCDKNIIAAEEIFSPLGEIFFVEGRSLSRDQLIDADVLLIRSVTSINEDLLSGTSVKFVGSATSGIDHVDHSWLKENLIQFAWAPGCNANSVVEYVLCAIASVDDYWERLESGGKVGVVGFGHVGKSLVNRLNELKISCLVYDPWLDLPESCHTTLLDEILDTDVITLHASLNLLDPWPSRHIVNNQALKKISQETMLINTARGELMDTAALLTHIDTGNNLNLVCDVWEDEPNISVELLEKVRYGTPHVAGYSYNGKYCGTKMLWQSLQKFLSTDCEFPHQFEQTSTSLQVPVGLSAANTVRTILRHFYRIEEDDMKLRSNTTGDSKLDGIMFDELRRNYGDRREVYGSSIFDTGLKSYQLDVAKGLGCEILSYK